MSMRSRGCSSEEQYGMKGPQEIFDGRRPKIPVAQWAIDQAFQWKLRATFAGAGADPLPTGYLWEFNWSTPIFDLRPDLLSQVANTKQGFPIWNIAARLRISLNGPNGALFNGTNFAAFAREWVAVYDANVQPGVVGGAAGTSATPNVIPLRFSNVTSLFFPSTFPPPPPGSGIDPTSGNVLAGFAPRGSDLGGGEGYPVRYWRLEICFQQFEELLLPLPVPALDPTRAGFPRENVLKAGMY